MMIVDTEVMKAQFERLFNYELQDFRTHIQQVNAKSSELWKLRENLPLGHANIQT